MKKNYKKIIAVTGASGTLGKQFLKKYKKKFKFLIFKKRIEQKKDIENWIRKNNKINIFLHFGAIASIYKASKSPKKTYLVNTEASIRIIRFIDKLKLKNFEYFLFISSAHVYQPSFNIISENSKKIPSTVYGKSKLKVEKYILKNKKKFSFKIGIARIFNFYSTRQKKGFFIPDVVKKISSNKNFIYFEKVNTLRDYSNLNYICEILNFMIDKKISRPVNSGTGNKINLIELIKKIKIKLKSKIDIKFEAKKYPGLVSNIKLLRKLGFKKKAPKFIIK